VASDLFLRGLAMGFSIAAPVGPIGVLCIRRTLAEGRAAGFASGLGAAVADAFYGAVSAYGLTVLTDTLTRQEHWLRLFGGVFLCYLGLKTWLAKAASEPAQPKRSNLGGAFSSTLGLTLTNPMTIISFAGVFAALGLGGPTSDYTGATIMVLGVFLGSALWWLMLSAGVGAFRERLRPTHLRWVNRLSGLIIFIFGVFTLLSLRK
jgi:threonine/homoserine/homoserine lactone efflux protein